MPRSLSILNGFILWSRLYITDLKVYLVSRYYFKQRDTIYADINS